ncbi:nucleotidyltransferase family protein [Henriciella aquimarina]|uniref:nucleotidyltransferase family protein n=1 Tax=Henriciella aquimarina TaxID=545261 RepID=UPI000A02F580|nr:NTP transferase domain-containing protein [Henriciella aquimarina]
MTADLSAVSALVLAGERAGPSELLLQEGVGSKADILIQDQPMLDRVLATLSQAGLATPCHVAGAREQTQARLHKDFGEGIVHLPAKDGPAATVLGSVETIDRFPLLVTTSDHPLLTPQMIQAFVQGSLETGADLTVGLASRETIEAAYPRASRTYFPIGGLKVSGCNLFLLRSPEAVKAVSFWQAAEADRKRPAKIATRFGLLNAVRMLRPGVRFDQVFHVLSRRLGCTVRPVMMDRAEAAIDVDKPEDLALVREIMAREMA